MDHLLSSADLCIMAELNQLDMVHFLYHLLISPLFYKKLTELGHRTQKAREGLEGRRRRRGTLLLTVT